MRARYTGARGAAENAHRFLRAFSASSSAFLRAFSASFSCFLRSSSASCPAKQQKRRQRVTQPAPTAAVTRRARTFSAFFRASSSFFACFSRSSSSFFCFLRSSSASYTTASRRDPAAPPCP